MNAIQFVCAVIIAMAKMFTSTVRLPPHQRRVSAFSSTSRQLTDYATIRVGTMPLPLIAPPAFVLSGLATSGHHGTGEFSLMERVTSCSTSVTSSPLAVFPLASSSSAAGSTNLRAQQTRIRISRASSAQICRRPTSGSAPKSECF